MATNYTATILEFPTAALRAAREAAALTELTAQAHRQMAEKGFPVSQEAAEDLARRALELRLAGNACSGRG